MCPAEEHSLCARDPAGPTPVGWIHTCALGLHAQGRRLPGPSAALNCGLQCTSQPSGQSLTVWQTLSQNTLPQQNLSLGTTSTHGQSDDASASQRWRALERHGRCQLCETLKWTSPPRQIIFGSSSSFCNYQDSPAAQALISVLIRITWNHLCG